MSQSLAKNLVHLIYSTKDRRPFIEASVQESLHRYAAGILSELNCPPLAINSVADHIHLLINLHRTRALADVVMQLKRGTSKWIKSKGPGFRYFGWQNGYGAFSVSQSLAGDVQDYIARQAEHHRKITFQDELRRLLQRHEIEFDERYVWD